MNWGEVFSNIVNHSFTAVVVTGLVSYLVVKVQGNNKKQEIDYTNEAEIKTIARDLASNIVVNSNSIAVSISTYLDLMEKYFEINSPESQKGVLGNKNNKNEYIDALAEDKIKVINSSFNDLIKQIIQLQLLFRDTSEEKEHLIIKKSKEVYEITINLKEKFMEIQNDFLGSNYEDKKMK